ncbi:MAG TPA: hypothetical protein VGR28_07100, partial [Candidatus Thermoplasmatota archaeon]|nr:hypothetical protein [Candidatus Thermoplasmatota archaeon]
MLGQRRLLGALVLGTLVASPVLAAITGPAPGTELIPSNTCAGGFDVPAAVDECGDTMTGDLAFQAGRGIAFPAGRLAGDPSTGLNFNGWTVCLANQASPGCGIGDITGVSAGTGLSGGGLNGDVALSVNFGATQARVLGTCGAGNYVRAIAQDGSVTCGADASNTYSGTLPISVSGTAIGLSTTGCGANEGWEFTGTTWSCDPVQQRVTGSCAAGNYVRVINQDGTVTCGADANTLYSAGNGLTLSGTAFSVLGCASGQILKAGTSGTWACASDANSGGTVTSVSTGEGLTGGPVTAAGTLALATPTAGALGGIHATSCEVGSLVSGVDAQGYVVCSPPGAGIGSSVPRANKKATLASSTGTLGAMSTTLGDDGYPITAFYDGAGGDLKVAHCSRSDCGVKTVVTVDGTGDTGKFPGIAIGTDLLPLIAYYDAT